jgi:predicted NBD/HSP70 family sugar kinase
MTGVPDPARPRTVLLTTQVIGDVNRSRVLQAFVDHGALSRADLARLAGVPRATIGTIIQGLLDDGLLEEQAPDRDGRVGKPGRPLWFAERAGLCVAVGFTDDAVRTALVNARGDRLTQHEVALATETAGAAELRRATERAVRHVLPNRGEVLGVGVAVPGVCDTAAGEVVASGPLPGAEGTALARALGRATGVPVLVDNDARVQALGEKWFGDARGTASFASVQTGAGLGVGLVLGGHLYRCEDGRVGELGHTQVVADGQRCRCGLRGCWETIATTGWLRSEARRRRIRGAERMTTPRLVAADGTAAAALLEDYAGNLASGLATLVNLLGTRRVILHGDAAQGGERMRVLVETALRQRTLGYLSDEVAVTLSSLDGDAVLLGGAGLVLSETFRLAV